MVVSRTAKLRIAFFGVLLGVSAAVGCSQDQKQDEGSFATIVQRQVVQPVYSLVVPDVAEASGAVIIASEDLYVAERVSLGLPAAHGSLSSGGTLYLGDNSVSDALVAKGPIQVRSGASARLAVSSGTVTRFPGATVPTVQQGAIIPTKTLQFSAPPHSGADGGVYIERGESRTLAPGDYQVLSVKEGGALALEAGTYSFSTIFLEPGSTLSVDSDCGTQIFSHEGVFVRGMIIGSGPGLRLTHVGTQDVHIEAPFRGRITAPRSKVYLNSAEHHVQVIAKSVRVQPDAVVLGPSVDASMQGLGQFSPSPDACDGSVCCPSVEVQNAEGVTHDCRAGTEGNDLIHGEVTAAADVGMLFSGAGRDEFFATPANFIVSAGADDDLVCSDGIAPSVVDGGAGNDTIVIGAGQDTLVIPGAGRDTVRVRGGTVRIAIMAPCELEQGERYVLEAGSATLFSPLSREEMLDLGVDIDAGIVVEQFPGNLCLSECAGAPRCAVDEVCVSDGITAECESKKDTLLSRTDVGPPSYPGLPDGLRQTVEAYVATIEQGAHFASASQELRYAADLIIPVLVEASATSHASRRAAEVFALGSLFTRNALAALVNVTLQTPPTVLDEHYAVHSWSVGNMHAARWLAVAATKEPHVSEHLDHLREVIVRGDRLTATTATSLYLQVGDETERRMELLTSLPSTHHYLLSLEYR